MNEEHKVSFLISKLVQKFSPNNPKSVYLAFDVLKSFGCCRSKGNGSYFVKKWSQSLRSGGRSLEIASLEDCAHKISNSVGNPNAFFILIDQLRNPFPEALCFDSVSTEPLYPECSDIPNDFLFVLQGIDGNNFRYDYSKRRFIVTENLPNNMHALAKKVSDIGSMVKIIQSFIGIQNSLFYQYASIVVQEIYINHLNYVSSIECIFKNLNKLQLLTLLSGKSIEEIQATAIICNTLFGKNGALIYNILDSINLHGDLTLTRIASKMKEQCFEVIQRMIKSWVSKGYIDDPFSEFFIQCNNNKKKHYNWWNDKYFIVDELVPRFLSEEMLQTIFTAGKCMNYVQEYYKFYELEIDESLNLEQYVKCASFQSNQTIMNLISKDNFLLKAICYIHDFVLLRRGDFVNEILTYDLSLLPKNLHTTIQNFNVDPLFEIIIKNTKNGPGLTFEFNKHPISAIVNHYEYHAYKRISAILFKQKQCRYNLINFQKRTKTQQLISYEMLTFLNLITEFFQLHILEKNYTNFVTLISSKGINFDSIIASHSQYVTTLTDEFWISPPLTDCLSSLNDILNFIDSFSSSRANLSLTRNQFYSLINDFKDTLTQNHTNGEYLLHHLIHTFPDALQLSRANTCLQIK